MIEIEDISDKNSVKKSEDRESISTKKEIA